MRLPPRFVRSWRRISSVARKELRQLARDPLTTGFVVGVPLLQLALFGYAINHDVRHVPTAVLDHSGTEVSRRLVGQLIGTQTFDVTARPRDDGEARRLLRTGRVQAVVEIPIDFARAIHRGRGAELSVLVDATDPTVARAVQSATGGLEQSINRRLQPFVVEGAEGTLRASRDRPSFGSEEDLERLRLVRFQVLPLYNPELRTALFVVPGLLGVILTTTMILMTALAIVRERERGTFEFLIATPVRRFELMLGKILPYVGIGAVQIVLVLVAGLVLFRVPFRGTFFALGVSSLVFIAANLVLGLNISARTSSQYQATQVSFFFFLPSVLLSGFMFPFEAMPEPAQWLGALLPLTHYVRLTKGILLRGAGLADLAVDLGALTLFFVVGLVVTTLSFKKELR
ncbi:MAG: ABC transporter permease [Thermoanaerobaculia bacterium]